MTPNLKNDAIYCSIVTNFLELGVTFYEGTKVTLSIITETLNAMAVIYHMPLLIFMH